MDIAALILSIGAFAMSVWVFIDALATKRSTHQIQLVSPEEMMIPKGPTKDPVAEDFTEFDLGDPASEMIKQMKRKI